jgi:phage gp45-like
MSAAFERRIALLELAVRRLQRRHGSPFGMARSTAAPDDSGAVQTTQMQLDPLSTREAVPMLFHYGFGSVPPVGSDYIVCYIDGDRSKAVAIASGNQGTRMTGMVASDAWLAGHGWSIVITGTGIAIKGNATLQGNIAVTGSLTATGAIIAGFGGGDQVGLQTHEHPEDDAPPNPGT